MSERSRPAGSPLRPPQGPKRRDLWAVLGIIVILGVGLFALPTLAPPVRAIAVTAASSGVNLTVSAVSPGAIALNWSLSATVLLLFDHSEIERSNSSATGPWLPLAALYNASQTTFYWQGLTPNTSNWWQIVVYQTPLLTVSSNVVTQTQPTAATLTGSLATATSAALSWTNDATYGPGLAFSSYEVQQSVDNGTFATVQTISDMATRSLTVSGLQPGTIYRYGLLTNDGCSGATNCGTYPTGSTSRSSEAPILTPSPLTATITAAPSNRTVGAAGSFDCSASGGVSPYAYHWSFGDAHGADTGSASHAYASAGTYEATCTVTDTLASTAKAYTNVTVTSPSGGGGNGSGGNGSGGNGSSGNGTGGNGTGNSTGGGGNGTGGNGTGNSTGGGGSTGGTNSTGGSGSGSGSGGGGSGGGGGGGGTIVGPPATASSPFGISFALIFVVAFIAAIVGLAIIVGRRGDPPGSSGAPAAASGTTGPGPEERRPLSVAAPRVPAHVESPPSRSAAEGTAPDASTPPAASPTPPPPPRTARRRDLDDLLDELEGASSRF